MDNVNDKMLRAIFHDRDVRRTVTQRSHFWFLNVFLPHYLEYALAPFHHEMLHLTESNHRIVAVAAFRGSGKSTIMNLSYTLWSIIGMHQKKFVLIMSKTRDQAKNHFANIKGELRCNELLKMDLGPFETDDTEWGQFSLDLPHLNARIVCLSRDSSSIRGIRFGTRRPDLIICDDVDDAGIRESPEEQERLFAWFAREIMPLGHENTRIMVLGNIIYPHSFMMRLKEFLEERSGRGIFRSYPLLDEDRRILWQSRFPDLGMVRKFATDLPENTWVEEFLLKTLDGGYIIRDEDEKSRLPPPPDAPWLPKTQKEGPAWPKLPTQPALIPSMREYCIKAPYEVPTHFNCDEDFKRFIGSQSNFLGYGPKIFILARG